MQKTERGIIMREFTNYLGWGAVIFFVLSGMNYVVKAINKRYRKQIGASNFKNVFNPFMRAMVKNHKLFGAIAITFALVHGFFKFQSWGFVESGILTLGLLVTQGFLGGYGFRKKKREGKWLFWHRIIPILIILSVLTHVVFKIFF